MKKYMVYLDDGHNCFKQAVSAKNEKDAIEYCAGNGDIVAVKDITNDTPISESTLRVELIYKFGNVEIDLIISCLRKCGIIDMD